MATKNKLGLSLSGGGYRAAAFHLGTLRKLEEMGILEKVNVLSTISGGSITGAALALHKGNYDEFHAQMKDKLETKDVIKFVFASGVFIRTILFAAIFIGGAIWLSLTQYAWLVFPVVVVFFILLLKFQYNIFPVSRVIEEAYDKFFYGGRTLGQFDKNAPLMAIGSSNLHTGRPFTFSKDRMGDSTYAYKDEFDPPVKFTSIGFPVSRAVMASSCVPFAFSPVRIDAKYYVDPADARRCKPVLIDGGVYDNQGIQKLSQQGSGYECETIITSDAGGNFMANVPYPNAIALLIRTVDLFMYRIKTAQMQKNIYANTATVNREIAYISLGWELEKVIPGFISNLKSGNVTRSVIEKHNLEPDWVADPDKYRIQIIAVLEKQARYTEILKRNLTPEEWDIARTVGTNLTALSPREVNLLIRHAENMTELQVRLYCPSLFNA